MMDKYGLHIVIFILALCVHSNIIVENPLLQKIIKIGSLMIMVLAVVTAIFKKSKQSV
ncbi:hypothetical protein PJ311_16120 [Bacillus sp. CLL-7-23]|uniref:Uncharacterized protein n=1 Tax=Bacillus changyiensis TaxID=3004103 RepID=A0ABT4X9K3_9BACI|nr:hypothetical protein [Bacillus changyiensis]MDA7028101.1 hypothetical protein [Bacillus changyiensis]